MLRKQDLGEDVVGRVGIRQRGVNNYLLIITIVRTVELAGADVQTVTPNPSESSSEMQVEKSV